MMSLIGLVILYGVAWATYCSIKATIDAVHHFRRRRIAASSQRLAVGQAIQQNQQRARQNQLSRELQLAILNLDQAPDPDFRRAAAAARQARSVPQEWRQRQYHRLRPLLVQHYQRCLARGTESEVLLDSLTELVEALGLEGFEAEYIREAAERTVNRRRQQHSGGGVQEFENRITQVQEEHVRRMEVIRGLGTVSEDVRQQLLEAEERRFQSALFGRE